MASVAAGIVTLLAFGFNFIVALGAAFLAAPAIAADVESGIALAILPRPLRRSDLLLGKWLAMSAILVAYVALAAGSELLVVWLTFGYAPPQPVAAALYLCLSGLVLLNFTLLLSTRLPTLTSGITALLVYGLCWLAGMAGQVGAVVHATALVHIGTVASLILPSIQMWQGVAYNVQPAAFRALSRSINDSPFVASAPPTLPFQIWTALWLVAVLGAAVVSFNRREC
jgi:ABC-type transport system involved in multi-copper enzyme maturation permease subunit